VLVEGAKKVNTQNVPCLAKTKEKLSKKNEKMYVCLRQSESHLFLVKRVQTYAEGHENVIRSRREMLLKEPI